MATEQPLSLVRGNTRTLTGTVSVDRARYDLTGAAIEFYIKATADSPDGGATVLTIGAGVTVVDAATGRITVVVPSSAVQTAGTMWFRLDVIKGGARGTAVMGALYIKAA